MTWLIKSAILSFIVASCSQEIARQNNNATDLSLGGLGEGYNKYNLTNPVNNNLDFQNLKGLQEDNKIKILGVGDDDDSTPPQPPTRTPTTAPVSPPSFPPSPPPSTPPTKAPSAIPTSQPSAQPSSGPTKQPSGQPSRFPTGQPTIQPNANPSYQPSSQPSTQPSYQPTSKPSSQPSEKPTTQPSSGPTKQPTSQPSVAPTNQNTATPTEEELPIGNRERKDNNEPYYIGGGVAGGLLVSAVTYAIYNYLRKINRISPDNSDLEGGLDINGNPVEIKVANTVTSGDEGAGIWRFPNQTSPKVVKEPAQFSVFNFERNKVSPIPAKKSVTNESKPNSENESIWRFNNGKVTPDEVSRRNASRGFVRDLFTQAIISNTSRELVRNSFQTAITRELATNTVNNATNEARLRRIADDITNFIINASLQELFNENTIDTLNETMQDMLDQLEIFPLIDDITNDIEEAIFNHENIALNQEQEIELEDIENNDISDQEEEIAVEDAENNAPNQEEEITVENVENNAPNQEQEIELEDIENNDISDQEEEIAVEDAENNAPDQEGENEVENTNPPIINEPNEDERIQVLVNRVKELSANGIRKLFKMLNVQLPIERIERDIPTLIENISRDEVGNPDNQNNEIENEVDNAIRETLNTLPEKHKRAIDNLPDNILEKKLKDRKRQILKRTLGIDKEPDQLSAEEESKRLLKDLLKIANDLERYGPPKKNHSTRREDSSLNLPGLDSRTYSNASLPLRPGTAKKVRLATDNVLEDRATYSLSAYNSPRGRTPNNERNREFTFTRPTTASIMARFPIQNTETPDETITIEELEKQESERDKKHSEERIARLKKFILGGIEYRRTFKKYEDTIIQNIGHILPVIEGALRAQNRNQGTDLRLTEEMIQQLIKDDTEAGLSASEELTQRETHSPYRQSRANTAQNTARINGSPDHFASSFRSYDGDNNYDLFNNGYQTPFANRRPANNNTEELEGKIPASVVTPIREDQSHGNYQEQIGRQNQEFLERNRNNQNALDMITEDYITPTATNNHNLFEEEMERQFSNHDFSRGGAYIDSPENSNDSRESEYNPSTKNVKSPKGSSVSKKGNEKDQGKS